MRRSVVAGLSLLVLLPCVVRPRVAHADWQAVETIKTYPVEGRSGAELYASIGERGPGVGSARAVAYTTFKLTWQRNYQPQGQDCVLVSAKPKLIITTLLPKPASSLPPAVRVSWKRFIDGVQAHEAVHGVHIKEMVKQIEAFSVGLKAENDPRCQKIRARLTERLGELSQAQRQRGRDFDRVELGEGGTIQQLVLALVNGA